MSVAQAEGTPAATASPDSAAGMATPDEAVTPAASPVDDSTPVTVDSTPVAGATGSIAGTVTTQDGTALDGLTVTVFYVNAGVIDSGTTVAYSALTVDPASGAYSIDGLAPGTYAVVAYDDTHAATWVGGSTITIFQNGALTVDGHLIDIVTIPTAGGAVTGQDIALAPSPVITGTITPAVDGLTVQTCHVNNTGSSPYLDECGSFGVTVDASTGAYTVTRDGFGYPLNPGDQYVVGASATGYPFTWLGGYVSAGDRPGYSTVMAPVALPETNAPVTGADITLVKFASISGTVTATDPAVPLNASWSVAVCTIRLVWTGDCTQAASSNLDPVTGAYIIGGLLPDTDYIVYSTANRYLQTWYGGWSGTGPDLSDSSVTVTKVHTDAEGSDVADINIDLLAGAHITGTISGVPAHTSITLEVCTASGSGYSVSLSNCESHAYSNDSDVVADISYSLDVTPGRTLTISAKADRTLCGWVGGLTTSWCGGYYSGARVPTIITAPAAGGTLSSQDVALVTAGTITGTITLPQGYSTTGIGVNVYARSVDGRGDNPAVVSIWGSGEYTIGDAVPGVEYMVCASTFGYEGSSSSLTTAYGGWYGNSDPSQAKDGVTPVTVQGPGETVAHVDIAMVAGGTISGTVTLPAGYSLSGDRITVWAQPVGSASASSRAVSVEANHFDGGYGINNAMPGVTYVVYAYAGGSDLLTTGYGTWFGSYFSSDPLPDGLTPVTAESGERLTGVDIAMVAPAYITGQVLLPDGSPATSGYVACGPLAEYGRGWVPVNIAADGSYSCRAVPGRDYVVDASIPGYPKTWLGGRLGSVPALPADGVTAVTVGGPGATLSGQDITMGQGWSLSGVLTYDPDGVEYAGVAACAYDADGNYLDCEGTGAVAHDGSYTITGLIPGLDYSVYGHGDGYVLTYYGGHVGDVGSTVPADVTLVTGAAGDTVPGVDITLVKAVTITGQVDPAVVAAAGGVEVYACPAFVTGEGAPGSYRTDGGYGMMSAALSATATPTTPSDDAETYCTSAWVDPSGDGTYEISSLVPGHDYVVIGVADGYENAWFGGHLGDAKLNQYDLVTGTSPDQLIPASGVTLVTGDSGEVIPHVDLLFDADQVTHTVTFDPDNGTSGLTTVSVVDGYTTGLASYSRDGYTLAGWFTEKNGGGTEFTASTPVTDDVTVYAKWVPTGSVTTYKVTFDAAGGTPTPAAATVAAGGTVSLPSAPAKTGFTFAGWFTAITGGTPFTGSTLVTDNLTVYAQWTAIPPAPSYSVTYYGNGATGGVVVDSTAYAAGASATVAANGFTRTGMVFTGWNTVAGGSGTAYQPGDKVTVNAPVGLYAQWATPQVSLTLVNGSVTTVTQVAAGTVVALSLSSAECATMSWNTKADGTGTAYSFSVTVTADLTLYAVWTEQAGCVPGLPWFTIAFDANGGAGTIAAVTTQTAPVTLASTGFTRACFLLTSWNTQADGSGMSYELGSALLDLKNMTLYAQWAAADDAGCVPAPADGTDTPSPTPDKAPTGGAVAQTGAAVVLSVLMLVLGLAVVRVRKLV